MSKSASVAVGSAEDGVRPLVAGKPTNRGVWLFAGVVTVAALALFSSLEARRSDRELDPLTKSKAAGESMIVPPAPLAIPDVAAPGEQDYGSLPVHPSLPIPVAASPAPIFRAVEPARPSRPYARTSAPYAATPSASAQQAGPTLVYQAPQIAAPLQSASSGATPGGEQRVEATRLANPATTIPQGAVVQAVLETALDSTRPGPARAIVSRDVYSFDGTRVLIPRGSRLFGDYKADMAQGQNRALIQWTRLTRPDGVTIALDSPSADPLGRAGVGGKVNSHFLARFGNAFLQTAVNLGTSIATNKIAGGTVIVGLPGSFQTVAPQIDSIRPTLKVVQGTPVSVFVARDLDFTRVEQ